MHKQRLSVVGVGVTAVTGLLLSDTRPVTVGISQRLQRDGLLR